MHYANAEGGGLGNGRPAQPASPPAGPVVTFLSFVDLKIYSDKVSKDTQQAQVFYNGLQVLYVISAQFHLRLCVLVFLPVFYQQTFNYGIKAQNK